MTKALYIKQHNVTGKLYFGFTGKEDVEKYSGSGTYWKNHLKEHGNDQTTIWTKRWEDVDKLKRFAILFSKIANIVESDRWANQIIEIGEENHDPEHLKNISSLGGKAKAKLKIEPWNKGKTGIYSEETRKAIGESGSRSRMGKPRGKYNLTKPPAAATPVKIGNTIFESLKEAEERTGLSRKVLRRIRDNPNYMPKKLKDREVVKLLQQT